MEIAIITGASAGLGQGFFRSICRRYPDLDQIWLIARRAQRLEELAHGSAVPVVVLPLDLTQEESYQTLQDKLAAERPRVRILVNNAGVGELANVADSTPAVQTRMVDLNCRGLTAVTTAVLPYMHKGSFVVNVASIAAFAPNARMTVYSSTKAFVLHFSRGLREELKPLGIGSLAVCPGPMDTEFLTVANITGNSATFRRLPYCNPEKVADKAVAAAAAGRSVYTPLAFFRFYRLLAKLLPQSLIIKLCKT
ncbi:MAG: SDR family NAD(P)-dependent oxidoreductase [Clostridia bacterium]|nr:SDR family NAD(P)-dependent oxidoreductase [Clostridia bacterium]